MKNFDEVTSKLSPMLVNGERKKAFKLLFEWVKTSVISASTFDDVMEWVIDNYTNSYQVTKQYNYENEIFDSLGSADLL